MLAGGKVIGTRLNECLEQKNVPGTLTLLGSLGASGVFLEMMVATLTLILSYQGRGRRKGILKYFAPVMSEERRGKNRCLKHYRSRMAMFQQ